jgi:DNA-binding MarR family transcriptional regulator
MNETPSVRYQALLSLLRAAEAIWDASRTFFARWDISPAQFNILNLLRGKPNGLSQTDLSRELIVHRSNITGLVDRLEEHGWVERLDTAGDRRAYRVVLTGRGKALVEEILPSYYAAAEATWDGVSTADVRKLTPVFETLVTNARKTASQKN